MVSVMARPRPKLFASRYVSCRDLDGDCCTGCHHEEDDGFANLADQVSRTTTAFCCVFNPDYGVADLTSDQHWRDRAAKALRNQRQRKASDDA